MNDASSILVAHCGSRKVTREELKEIPVPQGTRTHQPLSHFEIVEVLEEALSFRYLKVAKDEYAVSNDGMKMFGVMDLRFGFDGGRFSVGLRNSNDKSIRLALTAGYRVFVCDNMAFSGDFTPLLHKHTRNLSLIDSISIAVDRIHRGFATLEKRIKEMKDYGLTDNDARLLIYRAFLEREIKGAPRNLMTVVHDYYFNPTPDAFIPRNLWSLSNAFTSAFKELAPIKIFETTARLGSFLKGVQDGLNWRPEDQAILPVKDESYPFTKDESQREPQYAGNGLNDGPATSLPINPFCEVVDDVIRQEATDSVDEEDMAEILADYANYYDEDEFYEKEEEADEMMEDYEKQIAA